MQLQQVAIDHWQYLPPYGDELVAYQLLIRRFLVVIDLNNVQTIVTDEHFLNQRRFEKYQQHTIMYYPSETAFHTARIKVIAIKLNTREMKRPLFKML